MSTTLEDRLRALGDDLLAASAPITRSDLHDVVVVRSIAPRRRGRLAAAAMLAAAAAVIAVVVVTTRPDEHHSIGVTSADGRMLLDPLPDGWELGGIDETPLMENSNRVHLYQRSTGGAAQLSVQVFDARWNEPYVPDQHRGVSVAGHDGSIYNANDIVGQRAVSYLVEGSWVVVTATGLGDDELIALAAGVTVDDLTSGSIQPEALPPGFTDLGVVWQRLVGFVTEAAGSNQGPQVNWHQDDSGFGFYSVPGEDSAPLLRFFTDTVEHVEVRGVEAWLVTVANGPELLGIVWVESGRTYFANGFRLDRDELLGLVTRLGAASDDEWDRAVASLRPPMATIGAATEVPAPGSMIPTRITQFPALPADALSALGNPTPFAQYLYYSAGVDHPGSLWEGAIGPDDPTSSADDIVITVADEGNAEVAPAEPGHTPDIRERNFGTGTELYTTRDGYQIVLRGTDVDLMYDASDLVQPLVVDGLLAGYRFSGSLPAGLGETAAPVRHGFESGSFPNLSFNGGAARITVRTDPLANLLASDLADFTLHDTALGTAYVQSREGITESPDGTWVQAHVELSDGSTLSVESSWLTVDEVIALIDSIQLVTQAEWEARYDPMPAIVHGNEAGGSSATDTTVAEATG